MPFGRNFELNRGFELERRQCRKRRMLSGFPYSFREGDSKPVYDGDLKSFTFPDLIIEPAYLA